MIYAGGKMENFMKISADVAHSVNCLCRHRWFIDSILFKDVFSSAGLFSIESTDVISECCTEGA